MEDRFELFTVQIAKASRLIKAIKSQELSKFNLQGSNAYCLYYLNKSENGLTPKELTEVCGEDKALVSRTIENLESNGYITLMASAEKRYKNPIVLTEKGKEIGKFVSEKVDSVLNKVSVGISEKERIAFYSTLLKINDNLQKISNEIGEKQW